MNNKNNKDIPTRNYIKINTAEQTFNLITVLVIINTIILVVLAIYGEL